MAAAEDLKTARARYVRTLLAWHGLAAGELARILGLTVASAYKKLDGRRSFTADDLIAIAEATGVDPGLLLRPPSLDELLGSSNIRWYSGTAGPIAA